MRTMREALQQAHLQDGRTLDALSHDSPVLVVFLRQFGCMFAREALHDLASRRAAIAAAGARLVVVHMSGDALAAIMLNRYGLGDVPRVSDPERRLHRAFRLGLGRLGQLLDPRVWARGFLACVLARHRPERADGDSRQMPGVFLIHRGQVVRSHRHRTVADRPDYVALASTTHGQGRAWRPALSPS